jgi:hypothetical protein
MVTLQEAKALRHGQTLYHNTLRNADGSAQRWRVNGAVKTWKRNPERVQIPVKHGLYDYGYVTETDLESFSLYDMTQEEED